jgi:hypothetical protein
VEETPLNGDSTSDPDSEVMNAPDDKPHEQEAEHAEELSEPSMAATEPQRRSLKLVLTLTPTGTAGYHALLALGADDCDPLFRRVEVDDLPAALQEVVALVAAAEDRWQMQPRSPASTTRAEGKSAKHPGTKQRLAEEQAKEPGTQSPNAELAESDQSDQLPLFG